MLEKGAGKLFFKFGFVSFNLFKKWDNKCKINAVRRVSSEEHSGWQLVGGMLSALPIFEGLSLGEGLDMLR